MKFPQDVGVFRIFETKYFLQLLNTDDKTTPTLSLMYWAGVSFETIELDRDERFAGTSGYNFTKWSPWHLIESSLFPRRQLG